MNRLPLPLQLCVRDRATSSRHFRRVAQNLFAAAFSTAAILTISFPSQAQTTPATRRPNQPTPQQLRNFVTSFQANIETGCLNGKPNTKNPQNFCKCYASSFSKRFTPNELVIINGLVNQNQQAVNVVNMMMSPERRACLASDL